MKPLEGQKVVYLVQSTSAALGASALLPGNQTEGSWSQEHDMIDEQTKSGRVVGYGPKSETFELSLYAEMGDPGQVALQDDYDNKRQVKVWRVVTEKNANNKYDARFGYTIIENLEYSDGEGFVEISTTLPVIGITKPGTLDTLPAAVIDLLDYAFEQPGQKTGEVGGAVSLPDPTAVAVDSATKSVTIGGLVDIIATTLPEAANKELTFTSDTPAKATVNAYGRVIGVTAGTAKITVASKSKSTIKKEVTVTVTA
ncbi:phage major tail protein, TP901-1 family [Listeria newyorkensis]|uniref:Phage major tail protein, TP901-1 family n=1 Tax=Listeria newyorkensis TaxID=1497681 RepID=A0ABX4XJ48_9LIST|nr:phage major tail protein, TP901-1 family [Listeria newyorkensis]PNP88212.1 phage major tail protein, TP901-1 family [Listeria newyorkensis]